MKNLKNLNVLIVEDNKLSAEALGKFIKTNTKVEELTFETIHEADHVLDTIKKSQRKPHFVILSESSQGKIKFAGELTSRINQIKKLSPASEVIVLATPAKVETAIETFRAGAYDVVLKDEHASKNVVNSIHRFFDSLEETSAVKKQRELTIVN